MQWLTLEGGAGRTQTLSTSPNFGLLFNLNACSCGANMLSV